MSDKGSKPNGESKGSKGGSPFEEGTGEEVKHALQDEQGHESPAPTTKQSTEDDIAPGTFRWGYGFCWLSTVQTIFHFIFYLLYLHFVFPQQLKGRGA